MTQFVLAGDTSKQSRNSPYLKTSEISDPGLVCLIKYVVYVFSMAEWMFPFSNLLKPVTPFHSDNSLEQLFEESKTAITTEIVNGVKIFDQTKPTCLTTDWSRDGICFGFFRNILCVHQLIFFAVNMDGKSHWWVIDSLTLQNLDIHQSRGKL